MFDILLKWTDRLPHQIIIGALLAEIAVADAALPWRMSTNLNRYGGYSACVPVRQSKNKRLIVGQEMIASAPGESMVEDRVTPQTDPHHPSAGAKIEWEH
jgi:hypothetical protein